MALRRYRRQLVQFYKLVSYLSAGRERAGVIVGDKILDAAALARQDRYATMPAILNEWQDALAAIDAQLDGGHDRSVPGIAVTEGILLAPLARPGTIFCAGANYADHVKEMARLRNVDPDPDPHTLGLGPYHLLKASGAVVGPGATVALPGYSKTVDWESELAVVIGRQARHVSERDALDYVAGYTIGNDLSARDAFVRRPVSDASPFKWDWIGHKSFDGACPLGPWIVPARDIGDPQKLSISLSINGVVKQDSSTAEMIFTVAEQIAYLSSRLTLHPGDVILTGTAAGVGSGRGEFLKAGDVVSVDIERIGTLTNVMA
jgi:2-keto-4-pentenoate hydratase/2-oxohepta-3-ene-1,7-dioic acid hydratase in catechol pathway